MSFARSLWLRIESIHAVTYFDDGCREAGNQAGLKGFWMGYFGCRAAPLGAVSAGTVEATFFNFAPAMVQRSIPDAWTFAAPEVLLPRRQEAAAAALRAVGPQAESVATAAEPLLARAIDAVQPAGRPLFAANRPLSADDPVAALWQRCTTLREHRGDGHVAVLTASGLDGCEAHVLIVAEQRSSPAMIRAARGWTEEDWEAAADRLRSRGLLGRDGELSEAGAALRRHIEATTDDLATRPFGGFDDTQRQWLLDSLSPLAHAVVDSDTIIFPNPMGLPRLGG